MWISHIIYLQGNPVLYWFSNNFIRICGDFPVNSKMIMCNACLFFPLSALFWGKHLQHTKWSTYRISSHTLLSSGGKYNFLFKWLIKKQKLHSISISECSVTVIQPFGVITSPGFPQPYRHGIDCTWHIQLQIGQLIHISFLHFELRSYFYWWDA